MRITIWFMCVLLAVLVVPCFVSWAEEHETTTIILVRHAEEDRSKDEIPLTQAGAQRARDLAWTLGNVRIDAIYATPTDRTRSTARPIADAQGLAIMPYSYANYEELKPFLDSLLKTHRGKTVLISGHSDDVPAMLAMLRGEWDGGKNVMLIPKSVYDHLYVAFVPPRGKAVILKLRYGKATP